MNLAEHLFAMIPRETWRATGGDDGQGHYEGDYHAEGVAEEIAALKKLIEKNDDSPLTAEGDDPMWRDDPPGIVRDSKVVDRYSYERFIGKRTYRE